MSKPVNRFDGKWKTHKQWVRERGIEYQEDGEDFNEISRLPTFRDLKCGKCGHAGRVWYNPTRRPAFRCSRCGTKIPRVQSLVEYLNQ